MLSGELHGGFRRVLQRRCKAFQQVSEVFYHRCSGELQRDVRSFQGCFRLFQMVSQKLQLSTFQIDHVCRSDNLFCITHVSMSQVSKYNPYSQSSKRSQFMRSDSMNYAQVRFWRTSNNHTPSSVRPYYISQNLFIYLSSIKCRPFKIHCQLNIYINILVKIFL